MNAPVTNPALLEGYLSDASNLHGRADALVRPRSAEEVSEVVRHCQSRGIPLTVSAGRTSTTAAAVPEGGWVVAMEGLSAVVAIGDDTATAEGGINLGQLQAEIERIGRFYPPDPTSRHDCTLGASIACNASGARTFRYGPTRPWVQAVEVVLPTGEIRTFERGDPVPRRWPVPRWTEPAVKTAAGYAPPVDAVDVFVGMEGTLGIITRATIRLIALPTAVIGLVAWFPDRPAAVRSMQRLRASARRAAHSALSPRCIEYFDHACVEMARARLGDVPAGAGAALFCEQEVEPAIGEEGHLSAWIDALQADGALIDDTVVATDDAARQRLLAFRHAVPAGINERVVANGMPKVGTDLAVPDAALDAMMDAYENAPVESVLFGHLGDNHLHLNLLPRTAEELAIARSYYAALAERAIGFGGTVSGEHGIGKTKKALLASMVGPDVIAQFQALKRHLDPKWILGRGNLVDP